MSKIYYKVQIGLCICLAGIATPLSVGSVSYRQAVQPFVSTCGTDNEISLKERSAIDEGALKFVQNALGPNPEAAYSVFTADAKAHVSSEEFVAGLKQGIQSMGPFKDLHIVHRYLAKVTGNSQDQQRVVCGNLSSPEGWVAVLTRPGPAQGYVIMEAETLNNTWGFVIWMLSEQGDWHVHYFQPAPTSIVGKTAGDLEEMAKSEREKNHSFNSYVLFGTALQLAGRGPFLQLGIQQEIQESAGNLQAPHDLQGAPPFNWRFGKSSFKVLNVGPIGVAQKIYLKIDHEIEPWADDKEADKTNHELISVFSLAYPEFRSVFAGLVITAHERGGSRSFGTVSENDGKTKQ